MSEFGEIMLAVGVFTGCLLGLTAHHADQVLAPFLPERFLDMHHDFHNMFRFRLNTV